MSNVTYHIAIAKGAGARLDPDGMWVAFRCDYGGDSRPRILGRSHSLRAAFEAVLQHAERHDSYPDDCRIIVGGAFGEIWRQLSQGEEKDSLALDV